MRFWPHKAVEEVEVLHETKFTIKGNEPFLKYTQTGIIINLNDRFGSSHNLVETPFGFAGIPVSKLKRGDQFRMQLCRVTTVEKVPWYAKIWKRFSK
jgi:hypothetical protein